MQETCEFKHSFKAARADGGRAKTINKYINGLLVLTTINLRFKEINENAQND